MVSVERGQEGTGMKKGLCAKVLGLNSVGNREPGRGEAGSRGAVSSGIQE